MFNKHFRILVVITAIIICFTYCPDYPVYAVQYDDISTEHSYRTSISVVSDLGFFMGYTDGSFRPEEFVTKEDFAAALLQAIGIEAQTKNEYQLMVVSLGILDEAKSQERISCDEAVKMLTAAMGYTYYAELNGGYPIGFYAAAHNIKLWYPSHGGSITRGDAANMIYVALERPLMQANSLSEGNLRYTQDG